MNVKAISIFGKWGYSMMPGIKPILLTIVIISAFGLAGMAQVTATASSSSAGKYFQVEYPPSTAAGELQIGVTYTLWIPNGVKTIRGVIVHQHGAGTSASNAGAAAAYDLHWQALAKKWDCALLGPSYHVLNEGTEIGPGEAELWYDPRRGSDKVFCNALVALGQKAGHPEIGSAPWCLWGHSGGAQWISQMTVMHPDRVVAAWIRSGGTTKFHSRHPEWPDPELTEAVYSVPIFTNAGLREKGSAEFNGAWIGMMATFEEYRPHGAPVGMAPDPLTAHNCGDSRYLAIPFFDACLAMRLPDKGAPTQTLKPVDMSTAWLANEFGDAAVPAAEYKGDLKKSVWLPNATVASAWMEYVKTGTVGDSTPPPAPFNVQMAEIPGQGNEITWDAAADLESGIDGFIIMRDGKRLARVPSTAKDPVHGSPRPVLQGVSFHDTPEIPLPEMRYLDISSHTGEKHTYTVVTLNGTGLSSKSSKPATISKIHETTKKQ